jgi:GTP-binding protein
MRFIDEAIVTFRAGHGGRGCVSFRREKFIPRGGPDGGNGGRGGDVILIANPELSTLQDFRFKRLYVAENGQPGQGNNKTGRDGNDIEIHVPVGTVIRDLETGEILKDLTEPGERWVACSGGRGGKGNAHFVSSTFQAPRFAQPGEPGAEISVKMELKLLADAALVGYPNAGKSTLISKLSAARPKIADYPFTTLVPNLGVVTTSTGEHFVLADIPGLIEGAHRGEGLGHRFLKHIERTRVRVTLIDAQIFVQDLELDEKLGYLDEQYRCLYEELKRFNPKLIEKPEIVAVSKVDLVSKEFESVIQNSLQKLIADLTGKTPEILFISSATHTGLEELKSKIALIVHEVPKVSSTRKALAPKLKTAHTVMMPDSDEIRFKPKSLQG